MWRIAQRRWGSCIIMHPNRAAPVRKPHGREPEKLTYSKGSEHTYWTKALPKRNRPKTRRTELSGAWTRIVLRPH